MLRAPDSQPTAAQYVKAALSNAQELGEVVIVGKSKTSKDAVTDAQFCPERGLALISWAHSIFNVLLFRRISDRKREFAVQAAPPPTAAINLDVKLELSAQKRTIAN
eukprot:s4341_g3.t1